MNPYASRMARLRHNCKDMQAVNAGENFFDSITTRVIGIAKRVLPLIFLVSVVALLYYIFRGYLADFHSDAAVKNLLAQEALRQRTYFPSDWNYVNGDLWVLFGQALIIPLLPFFKNGYALHAVSGLVFSSVVLLSLWLVSKMVIRAFWIRLAIITVFAGGVSAVMAENLFGQISYGNVLFISALTLYFGWRWLEAKGVRPGVIWGLAFATLIALAFWGNPQRALAYDVVPMSAAVVAWAYAQGPLMIWRPGLRRWMPSQTTWRAMALCAILVISAGAGTLLHAVSIAGLNNIEGAGSTRWLHFNDMVKNLWFSIQGALGIFGAVPPEGQAVTSLAGVYFALRLISILVLLSLMPVAIVRLLRDSMPSAKMFGAFVGAGLAVFVFLQITSTTPDMSDPITSARYMLPSLALGVIAVAGLAEFRGLRSVSGIAGWFAIVMLLSSLISPLNPLSRVYRHYEESPPQKLASELKRLGLEYGYATYWNAGATTVLSEGDVRVRQIRFEAAIPTPYRHLSSNYWYRPEAWKGKTFLVLTDEELAGFDKEQFFALAGKPEKKFKFENMNIWVFPYNIASRMPGWNKARAADPDLDVRITPLSRHAIGGLQETEGGYVLEAAKGESGFLHFGPYVDLPPGHYSVAFDVSSDSPVTAGYVDVVGDLGRKVLAKSEIPASQDGVMTLRFDVGPGVMGGVEFRVYSGGAARLRLKHLDAAVDAGRSIE